MAEQSLFEQLDAAVQVILAHSEAAPPTVDPELSALLHLAADLRDLPREDFRARLKSDLERTATMTTAAAKPIREGFHTVTPYLLVESPDAFVAFLQQAFGAEETHRGKGSAGGTHLQLRLGDSMIMAGEIGRASCRERV